MRTDTEDLALVMANAAYFTSVAFRGCGLYERVQSPTLEAARKAAKHLYRNRPVAIYAVAHNVEGATVRQRHIENWMPSKATRTGRA